MTGGPKARWFLDDVDVGDADPFTAPVEELGTRLDLRSEPELMVRLTELIGEEGKLDAAGVTCPIRRCRESVCSACPVSQAATGSALGELCKIGVEQEVVLTTMVALEATRGR